MVSAQAPENARLPYAVLYHLAHPQQLKGPFAKVSQTICITSQNQTVKPADIVLAIESRSGRVPIALRPDGTFELPEKEEWLKGETFVVTNQPKGTMQLRVQFREEVKLDGATFPYAELVSPLLWVRSITSEMAVSTGERRNPVYAAVLFKLPDNAAAPVIEAKEPVTLKQNAKGLYRLEWSPALLRENPAVRLPPGEIVCAGVAE